MTSQENYKNKKQFSFHIDKKIPGALGRSGVIKTAHGEIQTPAFVTVGTKSTVKGLTPEMLKELGAQVVLANTYHLYLQPGEAIIKEAGGIHKFMNWQGPTMTDSGGFQAFSLGSALGKNITKLTSALNATLQIPEMSLDSASEEGGQRGANSDIALKPAKIDANGVMFKSIIDGSTHYFTPSKSIEIQQAIGADIIFAFDECTSPNEPLKYQQEALDRTHRWAKESLLAHYANKEAWSKQALFGIVQGGRYEELRKESAEVLSKMAISAQGDVAHAGGTEADGEQIGFDGFGIGGSFAKEDMSKAVEWVNSILPEDKPRHLLGIGEPDDLFGAVENGCDLFDCVLPTRNGRTGTLFVCPSKKNPNGKINITNTEYQTDFSPIEDGCGCYTCKNYSRAYLSHLFRAKEMLAGTLSSIHNLYHLIHLVDKMREAINSGRWAEFKAEYYSYER